MAATKARTRKIAPGVYVVTDGIREVDVTFHDHPAGPWSPRATGWIAAAAWDRGVYTDYCWTKRDAVRIAHEMLTEAAL